MSELTPAVGQIVSTMKECAAALGVSNPYLSKLKKQGRISPLPDGTWDVEQVRAQIQAGADISQSMAQISRQKSRADGGELPPPSVSDAADPDGLYGPDHHENFKIARSLREREEAARARINRMKDEGLLVEKDEVDREAFTRGRVVRDTLMNMCTKVAPLLAPVTDAFELERMLREAVRSALADCVGGADGVR